MTSNISLVMFSVIAFNGAFNCHKHRTQVPAPCKYPHPFPVYPYWTMFGSIVAFHEITAQEHFCPAVPKVCGNRDLFCLFVIFADHRGIYPGNKS